MSGNCNFLYPFGVLLIVVLALLTTAAAQQSCLTPSGANGFCVVYQQCTILNQIHQRYGNQPPQHIKDYVIKSQCNERSNQLHMCCDQSYLTPEGVAIVSSTTTTAPTTKPVVFKDAEDYETTLNPKGLEILNAQACGKSSADRLAFGEETHLFEFPWMVLLRYDSPDRPFKCGGTLITSRYVLTAAHCFQSRVIGVRLGEHNIRSDPDCETRGSKRICAPAVEDFEISKIIPHPDYYKSLYIYDVGLIKLNGEVTYKRHIKPICLPISTQSAELPIEQNLLISGWGTTENGSSSNILLRASVPYKERSVCQSIFRRTTINDHHICAGGEGRVDSCKGDSGGPLFTVAPYKNSAHFVQYGIVSFGGVECGADKAFPGIYANVVKYMPWITSNID